MPAEKVQETKQIEKCDTSKGQAAHARGGGSPADCKSCRSYKFGAEDKVLIRTDRERINT